jgi:RNA polymerase sigma-70 factor (ECF subfamily)
VDPLARALDAAQREHPRVQLEPARFAGYLQRRAPALDGEGVPVHAADLYLACAALEGSEAALALLDARLRALLQRSLRRLRLDDELRAEVLQRTRERLLLGPRVPKLAEYGGHGALDPWLRAVLLRVALNLLGARTPPLLDPCDAESVAAPGPDPEASLLRSSERAVLRAALREALGGLAPRTRQFLALYVLDGLTLEQIGRRAGTHKSTVSRALGALRGRVLAALRRQLHGRSEAELALGEAGADLPGVLCELLGESAGT